MKRIGIVAALSSEAACVTKPSPEPARPVALGDDFLLIVSGMGAERAARAAAQLVDAGSDALLNIGFAGALSDDLAPGDVLIPDEIISGSDRLRPDAAWADAVRDRIGQMSMKVRTGVIVCSDVPVHTPAEKRALYQRTRAVGVDMESAAIVRVAVQRAVPSLVIRSVLDTSATNLPPAILECSDGFGRTDVSRLAGRILRQPTLLLPLVELAVAFRHAARNLRRIAEDRTVLQFAEA